MGIILRIILLLMLLAAFVSNATAGTETFDNCEFSCYFPGKPEVKRAYVGNQSLVQKQYYPSDFTMLKAECIQASINSDQELVNLLNTQARASNLKMPSISIESHGKIKIGVYSGNTKASDYNLKLHGRLIVGKKSILHLIVLEQLDIFPTKYAINFMDSFRVK